MMESTAQLNEVDSFPLAHHLNLGRHFVSAFCVVSTTAVFAGTPRHQAASFANRTFDCGLEYTISAPYSRQQLPVCTTLFVDIITVDFTKRRFVF